MNRLIVMCGPAGCGKTTLAQAFMKGKPDFTFIDLFDFIKKYKDSSGHVTPESSLAAHQEAIKHLRTAHGDVLYEIGTNRYQFNLQNFAALQDKFKIHVILCLLDAEICIQRVEDRAAKHVSRKISTQNLREKFKRVFPDNHIKTAEALNLRHSSLDMSIPISQQVKILLEAVESL